MADPNGAWVNYLADDPHFVPAAPPPPVAIIEEEEPEEYVPDTDEEDPDEDQEEYTPHGEEPGSETDSDEELTDTITDEEFASLTPWELSMLSCPYGIGQAHTARISVPSVTPFPFGGPHSHFEVGGPSNAPPPVTADAPPLETPTWGQYREVIDRVDQIEEGRTLDADAVHTLYCRSGADRSYVNTLGAHIRALEYRMDVTERELRASERERLELRREVNELKRQVRRRTD